MTPVPTPPGEPHRRPTPPTGAPPRRWWHTPLPVPAHGDRFVLRQRTPVRLGIGALFMVLGVAHATLRDWWPAAAAAMPPGLLGGLGWLFSGCGAVMWTWLNDLSVDRGAGTLVRSVGFVVPWWRRRVPLADIRTVAVRRLSGALAAYRLELRGPERPVGVPGHSATWLTEAEARGEAARLAAWAGLRVEP